MKTITIMYIYLNFVCYNTSTNKYKNNIMQLYANKQAQDTKKLSVALLVSDW